MKTNGRGPSARGDNRLVVAIPYDAQHFNEVYRNYTGGGGYYVANNIFNRLVILDVFGGAEIHPDLAESWEILDGGTTYRFHLRRDVRWHDGAPFTSRDVVHTFTTAIEHRYHGASSLQGVVEVAAPDQHTVDVRLDEPNGGFLAQIGIKVFTHILPAHIYEGTDWATNPTNLSPIGTGPFRFVDWRQGELVRLAANPDYFRGRPAVAELEYQVVSDPNLAQDRLKLGEVDFCTQYFPCARLQELLECPGVGVAETSGNAHGHIDFNLRREPWSDRRAREAVAMALDRSSLLAAICPRARPAPHAYLQNVSWALNPDAVMPPHDPRRADELLDEAGLIRGTDGVRFRGRMVSRDLYKFHSRSAELLAAQLSPLGLEFRIDRLATVDWKSQVHEAHDFDLAVDGGDIGPDPVLLEAILGSKGMQNVTGYASPEADRLLEMGKTAASLEGRAAAYHMLQELLVRELPRVTITDHSSHLGYRKEWEGWSWQPPVRGTVPFWCHEKVRPRQQ